MLRTLKIVLSSGSLSILRRNYVGYYDEITWDWEVFEVTAAVFIVAELLEEFLAHFAGLYKFGWR